MYSKAGKTALLHNQQQFVLSCIQCLTKRYSSFCATKKRCYYDVLGIEKDASKKDIRSAFVAKTKELHPDKDINDPDLHDLFVEVNEAYTILGNVTKRAEYDDSKSSMTRIRYKSGNASTDNPFGNVGQSHNSNFNPKFHGFYEDDQYSSNMFREFQFAKEKYRGERNNANKYLISVVIAFMAIGAGIHYFQINFIRKRFEEYQERIHQETTNVYESVREQAKLNGPRKQLQLLASNKEISDTSKSNWTHGSG